MPGGAGGVGGVNAPAGTDRARMIVVFGSFRALRLSQVLAAVSGAQAHIRE